jgi:hypothetical protein
MIHAPTVTRELSGLIAFVRFSCAASPIEKRTITFFGAFALIFNDVFAAITTYYIDDVVLNTFDRVLHFASFYLIICLL